MPETADYLWLGMAVTLGIMGVLVASYVARARGLEKDAALLDELEKE
ncbi:MAG: hypothetical protein MUC99_08325 [Anaerolineae bacterium]|jgi:hypothetical protein|nr:hypothetical protein [Anaerolineae bacterium]